MEKMKNLKNSNRLLIAVWEKSDKRRLKKGLARSEEYSLAQKQGIQWEIRLHWKNSTWTFMMKLGVTV